MTEDLLVDPKTSITQKRPRVKLEEMPHGRGFSIALACFLIGVMGLAALALGAMKATGVLDRKDSEAVWLARQQDTLEQNYDEYVKDRDRDNAVSGTFLMALVAPVAIGMAGFLWYGSVSEATKCLKGHVTYKAYSYCPQCGSAVYSKNELPPDEWEKRYGGDAKPVGIQADG